MTKSPTRPEHGHGAAAPHAHHAHHGLRQSTHLAANALRVRRLGIDTYQEPVIYMRQDCHICKSEGFEARSRVEVSRNGKTIIATLNVVNSDILSTDEAGLSEAAWRALDGDEGEPARISHPAPTHSFSHVRAKIHGTPLTSDATLAIVRDIVSGRYSDIQIASYVTACAGNRLDIAETIALTRAMLAVGQRLDWGIAPVVDKHCVGGLPGNRTTLIVVPIVAACGLVIPKTSSRAITSPAGTADTMETLAPVDLDIPRLRRVVEAEGGCIAWGGAMNLSPADDLLVRVERPLGLDGDGQMVASILSKKIAAGSSHVLIDIPVGPTAKVRSPEFARALSHRLQRAGAELGIAVHAIQSDGTQPVGRGIGPALEAYDVLAVLQNQSGAPADLRGRALRLAGEILEMGGRARAGEGLRLAATVLDSGAAWRKFQAICEAQGGLRTPSCARHTCVITSAHAGTVSAIDCLRLARIAKLAGAPKAAAAGILFQAPLGTPVGVGQPLFTIHAESPGELEYARAYAEAQEDLVVLQEHA